MVTANNAEFRCALTMVTLPPSGVQSCSAHACPSTSEFSYLATNGYRVDFTPARPPSKCNCPTIMPTGVYSNFIPSYMPDASSVCMHMAISFFHYRTLLVSLCINRTVRRADRLPLPISSSRQHIVTRIRRGTNS